MPSIENLVIESRKGDAKAQRALYKTFSRKMFVYCYRYLRNKEDAEDVLIQGFLKVFQHLNKLEYQGEKALEGWIRKIMVNEALMFLRNKNKMVFHDASEVEEISIHDSNLSQLNAEEIYTMIAALPEGLRTIFNLYAIDGYNHSEIAGMLGITESTSRSQLMKARRALQHQLTKNDNAHEA